MGRGQKGKGGLQEAKGRNGSEREKVSGGEVKGLCNKNFNLLLALEYQLNEMHVLNYRRPCFILYVDFHCDLK